MKLLGIMAATRELRWPIGSPFYLRLRIADADGVLQPFDRREFALAIYRSVVLLSVPGTAASDDRGSYCEFHLDGSANAALADGPAPSWEIAELFSDGKTPLLTGSVYIAPAAPPIGTGGLLAGAYDELTWSPARDTMVVTETGARGTPGRDAPSGDRSSSAVHPGFYPNAAHPVARTHDAQIGHNDLYVVPVGRKAVYFETWITNPTAVTVGWYPEVKTSDGYVRLGPVAAESSGGIGHMYGSGGTRTMPIVLNAGETLSINSDTAHATFWAHLIEFDAASPLARADIGIAGDLSWVVGDNILPVPVAEGMTVGFGVPGFGASNNPPLAVTGLGIVNGSTATVIYTGPFVVPAGGAPSAIPGSNNQFAGANTLSGGGGTFCKYFPGGMAPGDSLVINSNSSAPGQVAWTNYWLL